MLQLTKIAFAGMLVGCISLAFGCGEKQGKTTTAPSDPSVLEASEPQTETTPTFSEASEGTRLALIQACGRCHQSSLASHKAGAIAIFDLDRMKQWHEQLKAENLDGITRRAKKNKAISEAEFAMVEAFVCQKRLQLQ